MIPINHQNNTILSKSNRITVKTTSFSKHREDVFFYIVNVKVVVLVETVDLVLD